jgi:hypothetical protein
MKEYTVPINGLDHTLLLDDEDAERRGLKVEAKKATPANKSRATDAKTKD